jgi:hypothetical protein
MNDPCMLQVRDMGDYQRVLSRQEAVRDPQLACPPEDEDEPRGILRRCYLLLWVLMLLLSVGGALSGCCCCSALFCHFRQRLVNKLSLFAFVSVQKIIH